MVARLSRTLCHQVCGWKRSSWIRQPPATSTTIGENAIAFTWFSGSGVMMRSLIAAARCRRRRVSAYQRPTCRKYALLSMQPFGRPVVPEV